MRKEELKKFKVKASGENGYVLFYITHTDFKGRIRKHVGKGSLTEFNDYLLSFNKEIEQYFNGKAVTFDGVQNYVDYYVEKMKHVDSIFNFVDEFITIKRKRFNSMTETYLSRSSINVYISSIGKFKEFLSSSQLTELPEDLNKNVLDDYFHWLLPLKRNYRVKLHSRIKEFITFLYNIKKLNIDENYKGSCFTEKYDNQETEDNDRALNMADVYKLIELRNDFDNQVKNLPEYKKHKNIPEKLQIKQRSIKIANLKRTLDCFLFMCGTGMYVADVNNMKLSFNRNPKFTFIQFRRKKNNNFCTAIPIVDKDCFLSQTLVREYSIKSDSNFPLKLSLDKFDENLKILGKLANFEYDITSKMARKTFASIYYHDYGLPISSIAIMLGHSDVEQTKTYLRIKDLDLADRIFKQLNKAG